MTAARYFARFALVGFAALGLTGCERGGKTPSPTAPDAAPAATSAAPAGEPVVIGVAAPFTGNSGAFGAQIKKGVEMAAEQLNAAGGIDGRPVKLQMEDDTGTPTDAANVATTLASNENVKVVVGHFNSACSNAGKPIYTQAGMVMFSPASTNVEVTKNSDYVYRNIFTDKFQGQSLADYTANVLGSRNVAILYDNDDYGIGLKDSFSERAKELELSVVTATPYNKNSVDYRSQLATIQSAAPDILFVAGLYTEAATIAKQARELGLKLPLIAGDGVFSDEYIRLAGDAAEGTYVTTPFLFELGGERAKKFSDAFKAKYKTEPDAWAALSYDAFNIVTTGLKEKGVTREGVLEYLKTVNSPETAYDGLTGKTYFDEEGDCKKAVQVAVVKNGKFGAAEKQLEPNKVPQSPAAPETAAPETTAPEAAVPAAAAPQAAAVPSAADEATTTQ